MFWKILLTIFLLLLAWAVFFRAPRGRPRRVGRKRSNPLSDQTLVKCPACGIYIVAGSDCDCRVKG